MLLSFISSVVAVKNYSNYWLYKVYKPSAELTEQLNEYDVWSADASGMEVFMPHNNFDALHIKEYTVLKKDLQELISVESTRLDRRKRMKTPAPIEPTDEWFESFFMDYSPYDKVKEWYKKLSEQFPELVRFVPSIGKSIEGRDIFAIHLTSPVKGTKKQFYFESLIHAREWISGTTTAYITWQLLKGFTEKTPAIVDILDRAEFVIVPIVNPDGYTYAHNGDRMWRKNRRLVNGRAMGVDLNRNFDDLHWGKGGSSSSPNSETYMGSGPFSEPESKAIDEYFRALCCVSGAIDFHSYSQLILRPYGFSKEDAPQEQEFKKVTNMMSASMKKVGNKYYTPQKSIDLYVTTGTASDYFYVARPNKEWVFALTIELRPNGPFSGGFVLPPKEIIPTGQEAFEGILEMVKYKMS